MLLFGTVQSLTGLSCLDWHCTSTCLVDQSGIQISCSLVIHNECVPWDGQAGSHSNNDRGTTSKLEQLVRAVGLTSKCESVLQADSTTHSQSRQYFMHICAVWDAAKHAWNVALQVREVAWGISWVRNSAWRRWSHTLNSVQSTKHVSKALVVCNCLVCMCPTVKGTWEAAAPQSWPHLSVGRAVFQLFVLLCEGSLRCMDTCSTQMAHSQQSKGKR